MKKIKISEVDLNDGIPLHNDIEIDLSIPFHELFDLEAENLKFIMFKEHYLSIPTTRFLEKIAYTQCLASLLNLEIWEDQTIMDEVREEFFITLTESIVKLFGFNTIKRNPYAMSYNRYQKLKQEEDSSYTLDNITCIEPNGRTTHYFRDFLILNDTQTRDGNVLMLNTWEGLKDKFLQHKFISKVFNSDAMPLMDNIAKLIPEYVNYDAIYNLFLSRLLSDDTQHHKVAQVNMYEAGFEDAIHMPNYNNIYYDVVECQAIKLKKPELLFSELMKTENDEDLTRGLLKLGFKIIR